MIADEVTKWRKAGKHLPKFFRDFHDQKALIASMHYYTCKDEVKELKDINMMTGHIYIVDFFLWFMARHGYTLQKTRKDLPFEDINNNVEAYRKQQQEKFFGMLKGQENGQD
jgi:hypothetical protein